MPVRSIPAPGYSRISGKKNPPNASDGYWVQLRTGWCDDLSPWPAIGPRWIHDGTAGDVIAVRKA
jgi:hypothetical protein